MAVLKHNNIEDYNTSSSNRIAWQKSKEKLLEDLNNRTVSIDVNDICGTLRITTTEDIFFQVHVNIYKNWQVGSKADFNKFWRVTIIGSMAYQSFEDAVKAMLRRKYIALNSYIRKENRLKIIFLSVYLKKLEQQIKSQ